MYQTKFPRLRTRTRETSRALAAAAHFPGRAVVSVSWSRRDGVTSVVHMHCSSSCHVAVQKLRQSHTSPPASTAPRHRRAGLRPRALCFAGSSCHKCPQQLVCHRHMGRLCHSAAAQHDPRPSSSTLLTDAIYPPGKRFCPSLALCPRSRGRQSVKVCGPCRADVGRDSVRLVCFCVSSLTKVPQT